MTSCEFREESREIGHKGLARSNPYLAAERFLEGEDFEIGQGLRWPKFDSEEVMVVAPLSLLESVGQEAQVQEWVHEGGHLVVLVHDGEAGIDDWNRPRFQKILDDSEAQPYVRWLAELGLEVSETDQDSAKKLPFGGEEFEVFMESTARIGDGKFLGTRSVGEGRVTALASGLPLRNRYVGDYDHAELLQALANATDAWGTIIFLRFAELSFWSLIWEKAWPFLVALGVLTLLWLWKNLPRFGPVDGEESTRPLVSSEHHLESLGAFHWRLDRGRGLLAPLRESLMERAHRFAMATGRQDDEIFEVIAERVGISPDRVREAMLYESPRDGARFTRIGADLQAIHQSLP
ncbi:hypothetical protein HNR46_000850 [Haloferula luteola]|uniref:DUF4350 domain-containing protein n=1 Tax=Haloferula luteola TaxID=595692 RepID=A0A840UXW3_9BACT|nr:DUF4350 domain-containing protein [Haloferula luteola]MBB5350622.1 hypothetical protein [Haloferula luteola]